MSLLSFDELKSRLKGKQFPIIPNKSHNQSFQLKFCTGSDGLKAVTTYENIYKKQSTFDKILETTANFSDDEVNVSLSRYKYQSSLYKKSYDLQLSLPVNNTKSKLTKSQYNKTSQQIIPLPQLCQSTISYVAFSAKNISFK